MNKIKFEIDLIVEENLLDNIPILIQGQSIADFVVQLLDNEHIKSEAFFRDYKYVNDNPEITSHPRTSLFYDV